MADDNDPPTALTDLCLSPKQTHLPLARIRKEHQTLSTTRALRQAPTAQRLGLSRSVSVEGDSSLVEPGASLRSRLLDRLHSLQPESNTDSLSTSGASRRIRHAGTYTASTSSTSAPSVREKQKAITQSVAAQVLALPFLWYTFTDSLISRHFFSFASHYFSPFSL